MKQLITFRRKNIIFFFHVFIILGGLNGNLSVVCGSPLVTTTAVATESTTTTNTTTSTAIPRLSSEVSSTEPTTATIKKDVDVTESTVTSLSEECIYSHKEEVSGN